MFDMEFFKKVAYDIFNIDSPSGYHIEINKKLKEILNELGYECSETKKGNIVVILDGKSNKKVLATSAHVDTLGLMVRSINSNATLSVTKVGGPQLPTLDGEYCKILTREGKIYTGTIQCNSASSHVYEDAAKARDESNIVIRIDEKVSSANDVCKLGIQNGDYVFIEPKFAITDSGFIKSRFIDDKASAALLLTLLKYFKDANEKPMYKTIFYFVNYEEVGHGASTVSEEIDEFVTVDMGCVGKDLSGNEFAVSICAKDSSGPYDYELTSKLVHLCKENKINYTLDIFPFYSSDVSAAYRAGADIKGALIGQGVNGSHGMERTHLEGIVNTLNLLYRYLISE